jgi:cation/acetate symporter
MPLPSAPRKQEIRARLSGRAGFAFAVFAATLGTLLLLDRIGMAERIVAALGPIFILGAFGVFGVLSRTTRVADFHVAGRVVPATYAGLAVAALTSSLLGALAPPVVAPAGFLSITLGLGLGLLGLAVWTAPALRRAGGYSPVDMLAARFPSAIVRGALAIVAMASTLLLAVAGVESGARALEAVGASRLAAVALAGVGAVVCAAPGGLGGLVWGAAAGAVVTMAALSAPGVALVARGAAAPLPGDADAWARAMTALTGWSGGGEAAGGATLVATTALGLMCLAPLTMMTTTTASPRHARRAAHVGLFWTCVVCVLGAVALAASTLAFQASAIGARADKLPDALYAESAAGHLDICGARAGSPAAARAACAARGTTELRAGDLRPRDALLFRTMVANLGLGAATGGLATAATAVMGVILAAAGLFAFATVAAHDVMRRAPGFANLASARVAAARGALVVGVALAALAAWRIAPDPALAVGAALALSAAFLWPVMALSLWPRAQARDVVAALAVAGVVVAAVLGLLRPAPRDLSGWALAALAGAALGCLAGVLSSLTHAGDGGRIIRTLNSENDSVVRD